METVRYGLRRGRHWVTPPTARRRAKASEPPPPPTMHGEATWLPGLGYDGTAEQAWASTSLDVARERQLMLRHLQGITVSIQALP